MYNNKYERYFILTQLVFFIYFFKYKIIIFILYELIMLNYVLIEQKCIPFL